MSSKVVGVGLAEEDWKAHLQYKCCNCEGELPGETPVVSNSFVACSEPCLVALVDLEERGEDPPCQADGMSHWTR